MKKPAALKKNLQAEPPEATLSKDEHPWWKLQKTKASNPERTYITGNKKKGEKLKLIVEVTRKWSIHHNEICDQIMQELREKSLSKEAAIALRAKLCKEFNEK